MNVLVFKTDVSEDIEVRAVNALLTTVPGISKWNFDLDDCDRILRIVAANVHANAVEQLLETVGIRCRELE